MLVDKITYNDIHFASDKIEHGRSIKQFFKQLVKNLVKQSEEYWNEYSKVAGAETCIPLCLNETLQYSQFGTAISKITPIHLSEHPFERSDYHENHRKLDFWCLIQNGENGKKINYFIELKKIEYCISSTTMFDFTAVAKSTINILEDQITDIKKRKPDWEGDGGVYLGIAIVIGYQPKNSTSQDYYEPNVILDNIHDLLDKRKKAELLFASLELPKKMQTLNDVYDCQHVSIAGIAISKER